MGSGYAAGYADVIKQEDLIKFCPKEFKNFLDVLAENKDIDLELFAREAGYGFNDNLDIDAKTIDAYKQLQTAFEKKTGLGLNIGYHNEDDGSRYDEVYGVYWGVSNVYEKTRAGKKMGELVQRKFFVTFG